MQSFAHDIVNAVTEKRHGKAIKQSSVLAFSIYAAEHLQDHRPNDVQNKDAQDYGTVMTATGRLEWLLMYGRTELRGLFKDEDIAILLGTYQGDVFSPCMLRNLAVPLLNHLHPESGSDSKYGELACTLLRLTPLQALSLADGLEQMKKRGIPTGQTIPEFFASLGIDLR
jgi:hypothetical protein